MITSIARLMAGAAVITAAMPAAAQTTNANARIAELESRVAELESREGSSGPTLSFGSDTVTEVEFYGYLQVDLIYDFGAELGNTTFPLIGVTDDDQGEFFNATAQETRLGFRTTTPTALGDLKTEVEIDFYGASGAFGTNNSYEIRARNVYAELAGFRVGKSWSTFPPFTNYPITLDFQGEAGIGFARTDQVRYTHQFGDFEAEVAIEESNGDSNDPVFVAAGAYDVDGLRLRAAGIVGETETSFDTGARDPEGAAIFAEGDDENFYGIALDGSVDLWEGGNLTAGYLFGDGIADYLVFLGDSVNSEGDTIKSQGAFAGLSQEVGEKWTFKAVYGWRYNDEIGPNDDTQKLTSIHLDALYEIVENTTVGVEYFHGTRKTFAGAEYDIDRIQTSFIYTF